MLLNYLQRPCALSFSPCLEWSPVIRVSSKFLFLAHLKHHLAHTQRLSSVMLPYSPPRPPAPAATLVFVVLQIIYLTESSLKDLPNWYNHVLFMCSSQWKWKHLKAVMPHHKVKDVFCIRIEPQFSWSSGEHQPAEHSWSLFLHSPPPTVQSAQNNTQTKGQSWPQQTPPCLFLPWCTL